MEKIIFFITHKTLDLYHADLCFRSISNQQNINDKFNKLYIYNSHQEDVSNEDILALYEKYSLSRFIDEIKIYNYNPNTAKTLGSDIKEISNYFCRVYNNDDRILILKSDCLLSVNYFSELEKVDELEKVYFTAPFILAKRRINDSIIFDYLNREKYIQSDDITFLSENKNSSTDNDFYNRDINIYDKSIEFISCTVINDFSCHYLTKNIINELKIKSQSWGGINFKPLNQYHIGSEKCFIVHKYHDIKSVNRNGDREGPVHGWLNS